jgi:hypothetical protein
MADPTDPTTTTVTVDEEPINNATEAQKRLGAATADTTDKQAKQTEQTGKLSDAFVKNTGAANALEDALKKVGGTGVASFFKEVKGASQDLAAVSTNVVGRILNETEAFKGNNTALIAVADNIVNRFFPALSGASAALGTLANQQNDATSGATDLAESFAKVVSVAKAIPGANKIADFVKQFGKDYVTALEKVNNVRVGLLESSTAAGFFSDNIQSGKNNFVNLELISSKFYNNIDIAAERTGILSSRLIEMGNKVQATLPKIFDEEIKVDVDSGPVDGFTAMLRVASGTAMKYDDVLNIISQSYEHFGSDTQKALENVASLSRVSRDLELRLSDVKVEVQEVTGDLIYSKDATSSVLTAMLNYGKALKNVGASRSAIAAITKQLFESAKSIDLAKGAFINAMSGKGPGNISGGLEIELLKMEGKIGEVSNRLLETGKRAVGGTIVTLQEAVANPALQGQLLKQVAIFKNMGIAKDNQQAYKIFEAMQKGVSIDLTQEESSPQKELADVTSRGIQVQTQLTSEVTRLANIMEGSARRRADRMAETAQGFVKSEGLGVAVDDRKLRIREALKGQNITKVDSNKNTKLEAYQYSNVNAADDFKKVIGGVQSFGKNVNEQMEKMKNETEVFNRQSLNILREEMAKFPKFEDKRIVDAINRLGK